MDQIKRFKIFGWVFEFPIDEYNRIVNTHTYKNLLLLDKETLAFSSVVLHSHMVQLQKNVDTKDALITNILEAHRAADPIVDELGGAAM